MPGNRARNWRHGGGAALVALALGAGGCSDDAAGAATNAGASGMAAQGMAGTMPASSAGSSSSGAGGAGGAGNVAGASSNAGTGGGGGTTSGGGGGGSGSGTAGENNAVAPASTWVNVTNNLTTLAAGGGDLSIVSAQPGTARVVIGIAKKGLFASDDSGATWVALGSGAGSAVIDHFPTGIVYDPLDAKTFWESGIYGSTGGIFKTTDNGVTFARLGNISHNDLISVDFDDPARKTLLAGSHETAQKLFLSSDGGSNWSDIGAKLPADSNFSSAPQIIDSKTFLLGSCGYGNGACGVFRSIDGGMSWTRAATQSAVNRVLWTSKKAFWWQLMGDQGVISSPDGETWTPAAAGPTQTMSGPLSELPDGRIVALGKDHLLVTSDGKSWAPIGEPLPFAGANCGIYGFAYSALSKTFFIHHNDCKAVLLPTAIYSAGFDYTKE